MAVYGWDGGEVPWILGSTVGVLEMNALCGLQGGCWLISPY